MKNYDPAIRSLIEAIKSDKGIAQPWRNKAIGRIDEAQALLEKGQRMTNLQPPEGTQQPVSAANSNQHVDCICPPDAIDNTCPVHGK